MWIADPGSESLGTTLSVITIVCGALMDRLAAGRTFEARFE